MKLDIDRSPPKSETQLIPLINVVFLMLAFFMIAGQVQKSDSVTLDTPISESESERKPNPITVSITIDEQIYLNGVLVARDELVSQLKSLIVESDSTPPPHILVKADARLAAIRTRTILGILRDAGIGEVALATLQTLSSRE
ncbi:MAG: biopolymer transporter ExbD [Gammaproteobacteria bacterium]|nr:biopolymer transporter ExbD [Gammaproteobacteria bacterium]